MSKEKMTFEIRQINNISYNKYYEEYDYQTLIKELVLLAQHFDQIEKIYKFYNSAIEKKKVLLVYDNEKKAMILLLKMTLFFDEIESKLFLKEIKITNEEMLKILFDEIRDIKTKGLPKLIAKNDESNKNDAKNENNINKTDNKNDDVIKELIAKNKEMELKIKELVEENKKLKANLDKCLSYIEEKRNEKKKRRRIKTKNKRRK